MTNVWVNWTLPEGWYNQTGSLAVFDSILESGEILWNNITANTTNSELGVVSVTLKGESQEGYSDWRTVNIEVYANTSLINLDVDDYDPVQGQTIAVVATLIYDNGSAISGENVTFYDITDNVSMGSDITSSAGQALITYTIPSNATVGTHTINVSYAGSSSLYTNPSFNTINITVHDLPKITNVTAIPQLIGYGYNVTIRANVTDQDGVDSVRVRITYPNGTSQWFDMVNISQDIYEYNCSNTWQWGNYSFYVWANDTAGKTNQSSVYKFYVRVNSSIRVFTDKDEYYPNEDVNLTDKVIVITPDIGYRVEVQSNGSKIENPSIARIGSKAGIYTRNETADSENIVYGVDIAGNITSTQVDNDSNVRQIDEEATGKNKDYAIQIEYTFNTTANESLVEEIDLFTDAWSSEVISIHKYNYDLDVWEDTGYDVSSSENIQKIVICSNYSCAPYINTTGEIKIRYDDDDKLDDVQDSLYIDFHALQVVTLTHRYYVKFNISSIPEYAIITQANLTFTVTTSGTNANGSVYHANETFDSSTPVSVIYNDGPPSECSESNPIGIFDASSIGNKTIDVTTSVTETYSAGKDLIAYFVNETGENAYFEINGNPQLKITYILNSEAKSVGATNFTGYLLMEVQTNLSGTWETISVRINDTNTSTVRIINSTGIALDDLWNSDPWNTNDYQPGVYRVYVTVTDPNGNILRNDDNSSMIATDVFNIIGTPPVITNVTATPQTVGYGYNVTIRANVTDNGEVDRVFVNITYPDGTWVWKEMYNISQDIYEYVFNDTWQWGDYSYYVWANDTWGSFNTSGINEFYVRANISMEVFTENASYNPNTQVNLTNSTANNTGTTNITGYLFMKVQRYSNGWMDVSTVVDNEFHNISSGSWINLSQIWLNNGAWDTDKHPGGLYRVYAELRDPYNNTLRNDDGSLIYDTYQFNVVSPIVVNITEIRVYNVTGLGDMHSGGTFIGSGINTTFNLYNSMVYRVEIVVNNTAESEDNWTISPSSIIYHNNLNSGWIINNTVDIWYSNETQNFTGGNFSSGKVTWNTTLGGVVQINHSVIFYYVVNLSNQETEKRSVTFHVEDTSFLEEDHSTFNVMENIPPGLYNGIYGLNTTIIHRNESILAYARWNEAIDFAYAEYNSTSYSLENHTVSLPSPNPYNWTNHTIETNSTWLLGIHKFKFYVNDSFGNWNNSLWYLNFTVWGWASITNSSLNPSSILQGNSTTMKCRVMDDNSTPISGYTVYFYNSTSLLGTNTTNATGWASFTFVDNSLGWENITCNITDNAILYYNVTENNYAIQTLETYEENPPWYTEVGQNPDILHKGEAVTLWTNWSDDFGLSYAWIESNETGSWQNNSLADPLALSGTDAQALFFIDIPVNMTPGLLGWRMYANDSFDNENVTYIMTLEVWGWASVNQSSLDPSVIYVNETTTMGCQIIDSNASIPISGYTVYFYNSTHLLGTNTTDATGWAYYTYNDSTNGTETMTCNITDQASLYYNASPQNQAQETLTTKMPGEDVTPPSLFNNTYGLNDTSIMKGESILVYARWNEAISEAYVEFNSTSSNLTTDNITLPSPNPENWTNYTIVTNGSWLVGKHVVKIYAADNATPSNWNNTLQYLNFTVYGYARVDWFSPPNGSNVSRGLITLKCNVTDQDTGWPISNYTVAFYNSTWDLVGSNDTLSDGVASLTINTSNYDVGSEQFTCRIFNELSLYYYSGANDQDSATINLYGKLNATIINPVNGTIVHKGDTLNLNSTTKDENNQPVTPDSAIWYNSTSQIATGEDTTWQIPPGHETGPELIRINVSSQYYHPDSENVTIFIWGYSNITWISPDDGNYSQGSIIPLTCRVRDVNGSYGIQNYPVRFYYKNSTESGYHYIGTDLTNSTGYATYNWNTEGLPLDNYTTMCNITHNSTLYFNVTADNEANTTISLTTAAGILEVYLMLPPTIPGDGNASLNSGYRVGQNKTFIIKANVTCRNANCGDVQGTVRYNVSALPDTPISTAYDTPFFIVDSPALNPKNCSNNPLSVNDSCILNWTINSTGALGSLWKLDVLFNGTTAQGNNTNYTKIKITLVLILHLSNHTIDWGIRDPQTTCNAAPNHPINISLDPNSNDAYGIYIKGTNLTNGSSAIPVGNVTWGKSDNCANAKSEGHFLSYSWAEILNSTYAKAGVSQPTYYWIDIPAVPALRYHGYAYVMANATA
ncbi:MAG: hypothetical protein DRN08_00535 [Thermoplasmata archaeon]|nr:MAG: hypothetical protein DRN08_00535 [Thermoplasmata archaeon]